MLDRKKLLRSTILAGFATVAASPSFVAMAQTTGAQADDEDAERIVVTGSRILRQSFADIPQPAVVINEDYIDDRGFSNTADVLNETPGFGRGNETTFGDEAGPNGSGLNVGQEFVDLYDLGTARTLVVVNGRRYVSGNAPSGDPTGRLTGLQVDLNNFPLALVERIETISVGGAPIYGADAIAGTVNIILKQDFEGFDATLQYGNGINPTGRDNWLASMVMGANSADGRLNVTTAIEYEKQNGAVEDEFPELRTAGSLNERGDKDCFGNGAAPCIPGGTSIFNILDGPTAYLPTPGSGLPLPNLGLNVFMDPNGNVLTFDNTDGRLHPVFPGNRVGTSNIVGEGAGLFDNSSFNETVVPLERFMITSLGRFEVTPNIDMFWEANFNRTEASDLLSQVSTTFSTGFLSRPAQGTVEVPLDHPFLHPDDRETLEDQGASGSIFMNGIRLDLVPRNLARDTETTQFRLAGGFEGDFNWLDRDFRWDIAMSFGQTNRVESRPQVRGGAFQNSLLATRLDDAADVQALRDNLDNIQSATEKDAIFVVRGGEVVEVPVVGGAQVGDVLCSVFLDPTIQGTDTIARPNGTPTPNPDILGCVPFNPFGHSGPINQAAGEFMTSLATNRGEIAQTDLLINFGGELVELPAGWMQFNIGAERRRDFGSFTPDGIGQNRLTSESAVPPLPTVETVSHEFFGEVTIPVLGPEHDFGLNDALGFEFFSGMEWSGAYRHINQNLAGSSNVWAAGGTVSLMGGEVVLRGNVAHSVRAPSLVELFAPPATGFDQTGDPCDNRNINDAGQARIDNCLFEARRLGFDMAAIVPAMTGDGVALVLAPGDDEFQSPGVNAAIGLRDEGNPNLDNEISNSFTAGFIASPDRIPGLTFGADYISINVRDVIVQPDFSAFTTPECFDNSDFAAGQFDPTCAQFSRVGPITPSVDGTVISGFDIVDGSRVFINFETLELQALQANIEYGFDVADFLDLARASRFAPNGVDLGQIGFSTTIFAPFVFRNAAFDGRTQDNGERINLVGTALGGGTFPEIEFRSNISYTNGPFNLLWTTRFEDNLEDCSTRLSTDCDDLPPVARFVQNRTTHSASVGWEFFDGTASARFGINDVFGDRPNLGQQLAGTHANFLGRSYFFRVNTRF